MSDLNPYEESLAVDLAEADAAIKALTEQLEALERERERLALAICGGEDVPGYANAQPVEALEKVARDSASFASWQINQTAKADAALATMTAERDLYRESYLTTDRLRLRAKTRAEAAEARLAKAVEALRTTTQILSQCLFETILVKGQYLDRKEVVTSARATLAEMGDTTDE